MRVVGLASAHDENSKETVRRRVDRKVNSGHLQRVINANIFCFARGLDSDEDKIWCAVYRELETTRQQRGETTTRKKRKRRAFFGYELSRGAAHTSTHDAVERDGTQSDVELSSIGLNSALSFDLVHRVRSRCADVVQIEHDVALHAQSSHWFGKLGTSRVFDREKKGTHARIEGKERFRVLEVATKSLRQPLWIPKMKSRRIRISFSCASERER